ncbi:MAG: hypothetical protein A2Y40_08915 [Candidatus Margulisbacteria bacterium GWF2_35_9]|nr:MAG: hypothetical protein A2Y40_08915 [Candidatus Margulisbacteria bacterium GWF2_35_9]
MIRKYSIYYASLAALIVFFQGIYINISFQSLVLRTVIGFCAFYILGNLLGVITIESLLEGQLQKKDAKNKKNLSKKAKSNTDKE